MCMCMSPRARWKISISLSLSLHVEIGTVHHRPPGSWAHAHAHVRDKNDITRCAITVSNFSMCDRLLQYTLGKVQPENY